MLHRIWYTGATPWLATQLSVDGSWMVGSAADTQLTERYFTPPPQLRVHDDHCDVSHTPAGSKGEGVGADEGERVVVEERVTVSLPLTVVDSVSDSDSEADDDSVVVGDPDRVDD